jgi:hypothetical protein
VRFAALGGIAFGLAALLSAAPLRATPNARLVYARAADAEGCPGEMELRLGVVHRLGYDPFEAGARLTVLALIDDSGSELVGSVELIGEDGVSEGRRRLSSPPDRCADLVRAMALSASLALEHRREAEAVAVQRSASENDRAEKPSVNLGTHVSPHELPPDERANLDAGEPAVPRMGLGAGTQLTAGAAPATAPGFSLAATARYELLRVDLEVRADAGVSAPLPRLGPDARLETSLVTASFAPCFLLGRVFACGLASLGSLSAKARGITQPARDHGLYSAAGGRLGIAVPLSQRFSLDLHAEGVMQLARLAVAIDEISVWRQPFAAAGIGARVFGTIP